MFASKKRFAAVLSALALASLSVLAYAGGPSKSYRFKPFDVPSPSGPLETSIFGLSESGVLVGNFLDEDGDLVGFYARRGQLTRLSINESPSTSLMRVNSSGTAVGYFLNAHGLFESFEYSPRGGAVPIPPPRPGVHVFANGINDRGEITGWFSVDFVTSVPFRYREGLYATFDVPNTVFVWPLDINNRGTVVGQALDFQGQYHGFIAEPGGAVVRFDAPGSTTGFTLLQGINNQGDMVGTYRSEDGVYRGFVMRRGAFVPLLYPGAFDTDAFDIAENGTIVGTYNDYTRGFIAEPGR